MKKTISILITFSILFSVIASVNFVNAATDTEIEDNASIELLQALSIVDKENIDAGWAENEITRGEFARVLLSMLGYENEAASATWSEYFYGDDTENIIGKTGDNLFEDVAPEHEHYSYIKYAVELGYLKGVSATSFEPDRTVKFGEAIKAMVDVLGYKVRADVKGGWLNGYMLVGGEIDITDDISLKYSDNMKGADLATLVENVLRCEVMETTAISKDGDEYTSEYTVQYGDTMLKKIFGIHIIEGIVTASSVSSLTHTQDLGKGYFELDNVVYKSEADNLYIDFLGKEAEAFYDEDTSSVVYVRLTDKNEITNITADEISSYSDSVIYYGENGSSKKNYKIPAGAKIIYNGIAMPTYTDAVFDIEFGNIEIVEIGSTLSCIFIWDYAPVYVTDVNESNMTFYNKLNSAVTIVDVSEDFYTEIFDATGQKTTLDMIRQGSILSVATNGNFNRIILSETVVSGKITSVNDDEKITIDNEQEFDVCTDLYNTSTAADIKIGTAVNAYINNFGAVIWLEEATNEEGLILGYLIASGRKGVFSPVEAIIYSSKDEILEVELSEEVIIYDSHGEKNKCDEEEAVTLLSGYEGLIKYQISEDNEKLVTRIDLAMTRDNNLSGKLYPIKKFTEANKSLYGWRGGTNTFAHEFYLNDATLIFNIPQNRRDYDKYQIISMSIFEDNDGYALEAFADTPKSLYASAVVLTLSEEGFNMGWTQGDRMSVITKIYETWDENGEEIRVLKLKYGDSETELYSYYDQTDTNGRSCTMFDIALNPAGTAAKVLEKGDIIYYKKKPMTDEAYSVRLVFDPDIEHPDGGSSKGYIPGMNGKYYIDSSLVDYVTKTHKLFDSTSGASLTNGNPFVLKSSGLGSGAHKNYHGGLRTSFSYVRDKASTYLWLTTQNLSATEYIEGGVPAVPDEVISGDMTYSGVYIQDKFDFSKISTKTLVEYHPGGEVTVRNASINDVYSYENAGDSCSRVLTMCYNSYARQIVVINDYR